jgi:DNA-binding PadR family transcriptional regulator
MDVRDHLPLAPRDLLILAVLSEGPLHGYGLIKAVEGRSRSGVLLDPANLYRVLRRMSGLGWIRRAGPNETDATEGARRRTYEIAADGLEVLTAELARLERLLQQARPATAGG